MDSVNWEKRVSLRVSGKNVDVGDALRMHAIERLDDAVDKYFNGGYSGHLTVEREGNLFRSDCMLHLDSGVTLQAAASDREARRSFDMAADRIEKRLRRYTRRLKSHHGRREDRAGRDRVVPTYLLETPKEEEEVPEDFAPVVVAEAHTALSEMSVEEAVMALELADSPVVVFRNAGHGGLNVVYRRPDGHIAWVDPELDANASRS